MAYIQFVLSFLVSGDNATVGQILEIKGNNSIQINRVYISTYNLNPSVDDVFFCFVSELLPEISLGLKEDRMSMVNLILSTLKSRVSAQQLTRSV